MKEFFHNLLALGAALVVCLFLGEVLLRFVLPQQLIIPNHHIWRPDSEIGWRHVENTRTQINTGEGTVHFVTDQDGYRIDPEQAILHAPNLKILVIGDSFVEAASVEEKDAFPAALQRRLDSVGRFSQVVNDGVGGWGPNQYLRESEIALSKHAYDLGLVCLYVGNDVATTRVTHFSPQVVSQRPGFRWPGGLSQSEWVDAVVYPLNDWLEQRSHLFVFFRSRLSTLLARFGLSVAYFPDVFRTSLAQSECWGLTSAICHDIASRFRERRIPVLFVLLPARYQVTHLQFEEYVRLFDIPADSVDPHQPNTLLAKAFAKDSLALLDPLEYFRLYAETHPPLYGQVDGHLSAVGHLALAEFLAPRILEVLGAWSSEHAGDAPTVQDSSHT